MKGGVPDPLQRIREVFSRLTGSGPEDGEFLTRLVQADFPKNTTILAAGQTESFLSFVESGLVRIYTTHAEREITVDFALPGQFTSSYTSFLTRRPSAYSVQALTAVSLWRISHADLQEVYRTGSRGQAIGRAAAEGLFIRKSGRELSLLTTTAEERYLELLTQAPDLVREIPLKYLASYIGITPQALSRIRRRIS